MSRTLKHIIKHFLIDISKEEDEGMLEFPFDIESFCAENDRKIEELEKIITELKYSLHPDKNKVD